MDISSLIPGKDSQTTFKERTLAFLAMEVVDEMTESVIAITQKLSRKYPGSPEGKSSKVLTMAHNVIGDLYPRDMSHDHLVIRDVVQNFPEDKSRKVVGMYLSLSREMSTPEIKRAISSQDQNYFVENFDEIFRNIPFSLDSIKVLLMSSKVSSDDKEVIWDFLNDLLKICTEGSYCFSKVEWA